MGRCYGMSFAQKQQTGSHPKPQSTFTLRSLRLCVKLRDPVRHPPGLALLRVFSFLGLLAGIFEVDLDADFEFSEVVVSDQFVDVG